MSEHKKSRNPLNVFDKLLDADPADSCIEQPFEFVSDNESSSGGDNDYWLMYIAHPKRLEPYWVECEDLIEAMNMTFQEGEAFKAIWRKCMLRLGYGKPGDTELRNAEKSQHFSNRMVVMCQRDLEKEQTIPS